MWRFKYWEGLALFLWLGIGTWFVLWALIPPAAISGIVWAISPRLGIAIPFWKLFVLALGFWVGACAVTWAVLRYRAHVRHKENLRKIEEWGKKMREEEAARKAKLE